MGLEDVVRWTRDKLARFSGADVPVKTSDTVTPLSSAAVAVPSLDLFENPREFLLVVDAPGATPRNTHVTWDDIDTLAVHVQRAASPSATSWVSEYKESDWYRAIVISPDVDGAKATAFVRDGIVTIRLPKCRTATSTLVPVQAG